MGQVITEVLFTYQGLSGGPILGRVSG
jgi:hypothetical protein